MINFFRKTRKKLADDNKFLKYSRYAIGEIVLVVVGILIALQINNWNENSKLKVQEIKILQNLKLSLENDSLFLEQSIQVFSSARNAMDYLINYMEKDLPYKDSLKYPFSNIMRDNGVRYDFSAYEELKAKGINIISNETLRSNIISYYYYADNIAGDLTKRYAEILIDGSKTVLSKHFDEMWNSRREMTPIDYESLKKDNQFRYFLKTLRNINSSFIERTNRKSSEHVANLLKGIDKEIKQLEK